MNTRIIERIKLTNFKGFEELEQELYDVTVIIGNNTTGKTSILNALQVALGAILQCIPSLPSKAAYKRQFQENERFTYFDSLKKDYYYKDENTKGWVEGNFPKTLHTKNEYKLAANHLTWWREYTGASTTHNRRCVGLLMKAVEETISQKNSEDSNAILPLLLSFGTNRLASQVKNNKKTKERMPRIEKAYNEALHDKVDFAGAYEWFRRYDKNLKDGKEFEGTKEAFVKALTQAIPFLSEIDMDIDELEAVITVENEPPVRHRFSQMSDGFKSMINVVSEIAHRCIELNGFLGMESIQNTPGIVLIDEIDLYLHPKWQYRVLEDLKKAFPLIQFVVTTHSPFIVQSTPHPGLISLDRETQTDGDPRMESLEETAIKRMNMLVARSKRYNKMREMAEKYYSLVLQSREDESESKRIKQELDSIEAEFSDDPAYVALLRAERKSR